MTYNFNAGPATLPKEVLIKAQQELVDYQGLGISIMEASHRSPEFDAVCKAAEANLRELMNISDDYAVLFLQGGASMQFCMVPMNLLPEGQSADYADTGAWSAKAIKEGKNLGNVNVVCSSKETTYNYIPALDTWNTDPNAAYLHITSNNTIYGTQYAEFPDTGAPLIADMSSDILSRPLDISKFGVIYAGAQKNIGPSGVTLVIMRKDLAERTPAGTPTMLNYNTHIEKGSMFNTPPTFGIYIIKLVTEFLKEKGGIKAMEATNIEKAKLIYDEIDSDDYFSGTAKEDSRSLMNVTFNLANEDLEKKFVAEAKEAGMIGLKGHRSIGGIRASIYNAMPIEGCKTLVEFMQEFRRNNG